MDPELGIDSVIAIPIEDWSLDLVTPNAECIRKDGACIAADFPNPPDESRVEFFNQVHTFQKITRVWLSWVSLTFHVHYSFSGGVLTAVSTKLVQSAVKTFT